MLRRTAFILFVVFVVLNCTTKNKSSQQTEEDYLEKGQAITAAVFTELSGALQSALKEGGVEKAITYCNLRAMPMVDSLSTAHNAEIRRASFKYRNPVDKPQSHEAAAINKFKQQIQNDKETGPYVAEGTDGAVHFYAPIFVNDLCLKCHGKIGADLSVETADLIKKYYPDDLATGYSAGDFRGIWSVTFNQDNPK